MTAEPVLRQSDTDMRDAYFSELYDVARRNSDIVILSNDFGAPSLDSFRTDMPAQFINAAISEQNMMSVAAGMTMNGKRVIVYSIATFASLRALEQVKIDICAMRRPVTILAVGAGYAYSADGPTHHATEDVSVMRSLAGMTVYSPSEPAMAAALARDINKTAGPTYIRLDRGKWPVRDKAEAAAVGAAGMRVLGDGCDLALISSGIMTHRALETAALLEKSNISVRVVDIVRLKPLNIEALERALAPATAVATLEEHTLNGGLGGLTAEAMADLGMLKRLKRLGIPDDQLYAYGGRERLHADRGLDAPALARSLAAWLAVG
jgi:transketolase